MNANTNTNCVRSRFFLKKLTVPQRGINLYINIVLLYLWICILLLRGITWIKTKSLFTPKVLEMSYAHIIEIVWIMPSKITGNIGHAWVVNINITKNWLQTFWFRLQAATWFIRFHRRFIRKKEIFHYNRWLIFK